MAGGQLLTCTRPLTPLSFCSPQPPGPPSLHPRLPGPSVYPEHTLLTTPSGESSSLSQHTLHELVERGARL